MYISYSGWKLYDSCPRAYWHRYVNKTRTPPDNRVHMLYGESVGILFEKFYADRLWKKDDVVAELLSMVDSTMALIVKKETARGGVFDWKEKGLKPDTRSQEAVKETVVEAIPRGVEIIRYHRLLGVKAGAEIKLDADIGGHRLGGRADFLMERARPHNDRVLIDGKGSRWREKYVDRRQLKWYAMLHQELRGTIPDKLGFLYWRPPMKGEFNPEAALDWIPCTQRDIEILKDAVLGSLETIEASKRQLMQAPGEATLATAFEVRPASDCKFCSYLGGCPQGAAFLEKKVPLPEGIGVEDIGL